MQETIWQGCDGGKASDAANWTQGVPSGSVAAVFDRECSVRWDLNSCSISIVILCDPSQVHIVGFSDNCRMAGEYWCPAVIYECWVNGQQQLSAVKCQNHPPPDPDFAWRCLVDPSRSYLPWTREELTAAAFGVPRPLGVHATFTSVATGNWTADATWDVGVGYPQAADTAIIANTHTVTIDTAAQACTTLTVNAGGTLTDVTNNLGLTVSGITTVSGVLNCGAGAKNLGTASAQNEYALRIYAGGAFTGGSGTHNINCLLVIGASATATLSTGTTTMIGSGGVPTNIGNTLAVSGTASLTFPTNSTVIFNYAGNQQLYKETGGTFGNFYNLTINNASCVVRWYQAAGQNTTVSNNFTITAGIYNTREHAGTTDHNLTVTGVSSITGTLTTNTSTYTGNGAVTVNSGGTLGAATAWTGAFTSTLTVDSGGTYVAARTWNQTGNCTIDSGSTYTANSETYTVYGSHTLDSGSKVINAIAYNAALTLTISTNLTATTYTFLAGSLLYGSAANKTLTATNLTWATCNIKFITFANAVTTPGTSKTITLDGACTTTGALVVAATDIWANAGYVLTSMSTLQIAGSMTFGASGSVTVNSTTTLTNGSTFGSAVNYAATFGAALTMQATVATFVAPQTWNQYGNCTVLCTTYTSNSESYNVYASHTLDSGGKTINAIAYNAALTLTISATLTVTTFTMVASGKLYGSDAVPKNFTVTTMTWAACNLKWLAYQSALTTGANAISLDGNCTFASTCTVSTSGSILPATATATFSAATTVNTGGTLGGATAWTMLLGAGAKLTNNGTVTAPTTLTGAANVVITNNGTWTWQSTTVTYAKLMFDTISVPAGKTLTFGTGTTFNYNNLVLTVTIAATATLVVAAGVTFACISYTNAGTMTSTGTTRYYSGKEADISKCYKELQKYATPPWLDADATKSADDGWSVMA